LGTSGSAVRSPRGGVLADVNRRGQLFVAVAALVAALVAGCSNTSTAMMGGGAGPGAAGVGSMMGSIPHGYHVSRLTCSAPSSMPGHTVYVMLGDMGMTHMMGGFAPSGAHMMLRALPARLPAGQISFVVANMGWRVHEMVVLPHAPDQAAGQRVPGADGRVPE